MRSHYLLLALLGHLVVSALLATAAEPNVKPIREIFVPFDDLNVLLQGDAERAFLTREEYEDLIEKAKQTPIEHAPHQVLLLSADYDTTIQQERAAIRGKLWIEVLESGLHAIPLELNGVGIRTAILDGKPASLGRNPQGQVMLFVEGTGTKQLELDLVTALQTSAAQQSLQFAVPTPSATKLRVTVPGNVEVRSGAAVVSRSVDQAAGVTRFELLPQRGSLSLVMSLNNKLLLEQRVVMARSVIVDEMTQAYERLHATVSLGVLHGAVDQFRFRIPDGFEVTDVASPTLARWLVNEDAGAKTLEVDLREPTTGMVVLNISAINNVIALDNWEMPQLQPLDVANHVAVVGILIEDRLAADSIATSALIAIDNDVLRRALPESVFQIDPGAPKIRPVAAFYAPQDQYQLTARFTRPPAKVDAHTTMLLTLGEKEQHLRGTIALVPSNEKLFTVDLVVPDGWRVATVTATDGSPIPFERIATATDDQTRLHIKLPAGVEPGTATKLTIEATSVPEGWLEEWSESSANYPVFVVQGVAATTGAIAVQSNDDLAARPDQLNGLTTLGDADRAALGLKDAEGTLVYKISEAEYSATFIVERIKPRVTARAFSFLKIEPEGLTAHYELVYDVQQARTRRLRVQLPEGTPESLSIRGLDGTQVKEYSGEVVNGQRQWTASLADSMIGRIRLAVDFEQPLTADEPQDWELPLVRALDVAYQSAIVAVEGSPEFDAQVETNGRKIDVGELVDADYQVGKRLLGAYGFVGDPQVSIDVFQRPGFGLPAAITQRAELVTLVAASGTSQTAARYLLRTKAAFLQISLPTGATLWSATVDGKPSTPQRDGDDLVISLPPTNENTVRDMQIVYETKAASIDWMADVEAAAPRLVVRMDAGADRYDVPTADVLWHLVLPHGHRIVRSHGTVFTDDVAPRHDTASIIARALYRLGGGIGEFGILPGMLLSSRKMPSISSAYQVDDIQTLAEKEEASGADEMDFAFAEPAAPGMVAPVPNAPEAEPNDMPAQPASGAERDAKLVEGEFSQPSRVTRGDKYWALQGVRSLQIELERSGEQVTFHSMGVRPQLRATLIQADRLAFLSWALAIVTAVWGVTLTSRCVRRKSRFVLNACVFSLALPVVVGLFSGIELSGLFVPMLYAALLLVPYYLVASVAKWIASKATVRSVPAATTTAVILGLFMSTSAVFSQEASNRATVDPAELLLLLQPDKPVKLPEDAVIIPYDPSDADGVANAEKVLVPYAEYTRLWNLAFPDKPLDVTPPPALYALADASYTATLAGEDYLLIRGRMDLEIYQRSPFEIPLHLSGGVLERATLGGEPAKLKLIALQQAPENQKVKQAQGAAFATLHVSSPGRKRLELAIRLPIARSGGWRIVHGQLPTAPATQLTITAPAPQTELRLSGTLDRANFETKQANESIATALPSGGDFSLQWRPAVAAGQVDQTLTVRSMGLLDIQEDGVRLAWQLELQTRNNQRETFTFAVPQEYLVERVSGDNVRGWQSRPSGDQQQVDVTLLKAATGTETITLRLSQRTVIGDEQSPNLVAPVIAVPDAVLHQGQLAIRRSPLLDLHTEQAIGLSRVEIAPEALASILTSVVEESPLGLKSFEAYRFGGSTYQLQLSARAAISQLAVEERTVLRIGERDTTIESRMKFTIGERPVHRFEIELPDGLEVKEVIAPGSFDWAITSAENQRLLTVYLAAGAIGEFDVDLRGSTPRTIGEAVSNPRFVVRNTTRQTGFIVVQVDPSVDVTAEQAENAEEVPLARVASWLANEQRPLSRLVMFHRNADYSVRFRVTPRQPRVNSFSVTNVRITPREIEELVFLKFLVRDAGIREVSFVLPESLRDSQITVPLLRQKTVEPIEGDASRVRVRLELQDQVIDELIVLVLNSRSLSSEDYTAPVPTIETGSTDFRYVVIESAGRDEVVVTKNEGFLELNRQLSQWKQLAQILPGSITQAYVAREAAEKPELSIATRQRATVETAGASIGLAQTLLMVDANGAYRGMQEYRVDNKTEQFLEIELPDGAKLWTVLVAGEAVKPTTVPNAATTGRVRVPLIKTQTGDLDYSVTLKYGGDLKQLRSLRNTSFPLMKTININVQQSHVRLRLPESQRWFNFSGSMRHVTDVGELAADYVSYQTKQVQRLLQVVNSDSYDAFSKVRAENNIKLQVQQSQLQSQNSFGELYGSSSNRRLQSELQSNSGVVLEAEKQIQQNAQASPEADNFGNTFRLRQLYKEQATNRASDVVGGLDNNFDVVTDSRDKEVAVGEKRFNEAWFYSNQLKTIEDKKEADAGSRISSRSGKPVSAKPSLEIEAELLKNKKVDRVLSDEQRKLGDVDEVSQVERYQQRLEMQNGSQQLGRYGLPTPQSALAVPQDRGDTQTWEHLGLQEGYAGRTDGLAAQAGGGGFGGGMYGDGYSEGAGMEFNSGIPAAAGETGLTSLDVALPERGVEYLFTTPRGDIEITAQNVSTAQVDRVLSLLGILVVLLGLAVAIRIGRAIAARTSPRTLAIVGILLGVASFIGGVLPVVGIIMVVGGISMMIRAASQSPEAATP
ncbi:MAG: hypothetical protein H6821_14050 [Planctomycetaceae bacterium]|nr:hypothetical protein [Planctomycetaceae bacterium]